MDAIEHELNAKLDAAEEELKKSSKKINKLKFEKEELEISIEKLNNEAEAKSQNGELMDTKKIKEMGTKP